MKIKTKLNKEHPYNIEEYESWLSYNAERGFFLKHIGNRFSEFWVGKPQKMKYRVDIVFDKFTSERSALYQEAGWQYVANKGKAYIFCAPDFVETVEITTDKEELKTNIKKFEFSQRIWFLFVLMLLAFYVFIYFQISVFSGGTPFLNMLEPFKVLTFCYFFLIIFTVFCVCLYQYKNIRKLKKKIIKGFDINHEKEWKSNFFSKGIFEFAYLVVLVAYFFLTLYLTFFDKSHADIEGDNIRVVSLINVENITDYEVSKYSHEWVYKDNPPKYFEYTNREQDFFVKNHFHFYEEIKLPEVQGIYTLDVNFYDLLFDFQAKGVYEDLIKKYRYENYFGVYAEDLKIKNISNDYFDKIQYFVNDEGKEFFVRKDNIVMQIVYKGNLSDTAFIEELAESMKLKY